jgi:DNA-binding CsgD family transcriptional regulator
MDDSTRYGTTQNNGDDIDSIRYQTYISPFASQIKTIENANDFNMHIVFDNKNKIFLSSNPNNIATLYQQQNFDSIDPVCNPQKYEEQAYQIPCLATLNFAERTLEKELQNTFKCHTAYSIYRSSEECDIFIALIYNKAVRDAATLYKKTVHKLEDFTIRFLNAIVPVIKEDKFFLAQSEFASNQTVRQNVIKKKYIKVIEKLTMMETKTLYLASQGCDAKETATRLNISIYTVKEYLKNIREKLNAHSTTQAASIAIRRGLI